MCVVARYIVMFVFFFFNDTATTEIYTLSLHDALPICDHAAPAHLREGRDADRHPVQHAAGHIGLDLAPGNRRSEEHTSELQSRLHLVCRLLLEKKKTNITNVTAECLSTETSYRTQAHI